MNGYSITLGQKGLPTPNPGQIVAALADKLLERGYSDPDCQKFPGGHFLRVVKQV